MNTIIQGTVNIPAVKLDVAAIQAENDKAIKTTQKIFKMKMHVRLTDYKIKTISMFLGHRQELSAEERKAVIELVKTMNANGWLRKADIMWCKENNIPIL